MLVFTQVVAEGSFTAAARALGMPKSTVSRRVSELEKRLGARLLHRTTRKLSLTDVGREYHARAARIVEQLQEAEALVQETQAEPTGTLKLTAPADLAMEFLSGLLSEFTARYPKVSIMLDLSQRLVDMVEEGFDLALRAGTMRDSSLVARRITRGRSHLFASPEYIGCRGEPKTLDELGDHDSVLMGKHLSTTWRLLRRKRLYDVRVSGRIVATEYPFVRHAAIDGMGVALLPDRMVAPDVAAGRLCKVLPEYTTEEFGLWIVYPSARHLPAKARVFIDFVSERMGDATWDDLVESRA